LDEGWLLAKQSYAMLKLKEENDGEPPYEAKG
jgi:hypothetical protein